MIMKKISIILIIFGIVLFAIGQEINLRLGDTVFSEKVYPSDIKLQKLSHEVILPGGKYQLAYEIDVQQSGFDIQSKNKIIDKATSNIVWHQTANLTSGKGNKAVSTAKFVLRSFNITKQASYIVSIEIMPKSIDTSNILTFSLRSHVVTVPIFILNAFLLLSLTGLVLLLVSFRKIKK